MVFIKPKRHVTHVYLHCSASDNPDHDNVRTITQWHKARGFSTIGYHDYISKDGVLHEGRDIELIPAAQRGYNDKSIAICLGGLELNKFTNKQFITLQNRCAEINRAYDKKIIFKGHNQVDKNKTCPVFDFQGILCLDKNGYMKY